MYYLPDFGHREALLVLEERQHSRPYGYHQPPLELTRTTLHRRHRLQPQYYKHDKIPRRNHLLVTDVYTTQRICTDIPTCLHDSSWYLQSTRLVSVCTFREGTRSFTMWLNFCNNNHLHESKYFCYHTFYHVRWLSCGKLHRDHKYIYIL